MAEASSTSNLHIQLTAFCSQIGDRGWYFLNEGKEPNEDLIIRCEHPGYAEPLALNGTEIMIRFVRRRRTSSTKIPVAQPVGRLSTNPPPSHVQIASGATQPSGNWEADDRMYHAVRVESSLRHRRIKRLRLDHAIQRPTDIDDMRPWHLELGFSHLGTNKKILTWSPTGIEF